MRWPWATTAWIWKNTWNDFLMLLLVMVTYLM